MSSAGLAEIVCSGCKRRFAWKPELAGKRVKCKCGAAIAVAAAPVVRPATPVVKPAPVAPAEGADLDGLFALADDAARAAAVMPVEVVDFAPVAPAPVRKGNLAVQKASPLGYQHGPTGLQRQKAVREAAALVDMNRDLYAPLALMISGFALYVGYYCVRFHLGSNGAMFVGFGLSMVTALKAGLLVGFALVVAGPLGVGFGSLWSAILKLAAIAVFTDGVTAWVDMGLSKLTGGTFGGGIFGYGVIAWPAALGLYWILLIHLFSMDPGDSWIVVVLLTIFDRVVKTVLFLLLMQSIVGWGGVSAAAFSAVSGGGSSASPRSHVGALATRVDELKESDSLNEARKYIADGHQAALSKSVEAWYGAGCPNVWFEMSRRDINGRASAVEVIVELPDGKLQRAKCFEILAQYYKDVQIDKDPSELQDDGGSYIAVQLR
jgi:hypothetical protein